MPIPVSRTANSSRYEPAPVGSASTWTTTSPSSVNLTAFESRLSSTCRRRASSPTSPAGASSSMRQPSSISFSHARGATISSAPSTHPEIDGSFAELEHARLDLRVVEDVVDHVEQGVPARSYDLDELTLLGRQLRAEEEAGHADHGVHRRSDLVAHRGEEGALRLRRRLGLTRTLELADVARLVDRSRRERGEGRPRSRARRCRSLPRTSRASASRSGGLRSATGRPSTS